MSPTPYYQDDLVTLYHGTLEDVLPTLDVKADLIVADPPYGETSLDWDHWPAGWPGILANYGSSMWCFGSTRMFLERGNEFGRWHYSQDIIWEKHNGSNLANDRFNRVHEIATFWYRGKWADRFHVVPTIDMAVKRTVRKKARPAQWTGSTGPNVYVSKDGGPLNMVSVIFARSMHGRAINETEKPIELIEPLIGYGCPPGGLVLDPFAGSCSSAVAARAIGRRSVCIEKRESQCEAAAKRLTQGVLNFDEESA